jgi:4'-phosphopantetheinyl transferase
MRFTLLDVSVPCEVWLAFLDEPPSAAVACLSVEERERAARFVFEDDRRRYQLSHAALRMRLGHHLGQPPELLRFVQGPAGKPMLADGDGDGDGARCAFNLSHSGDVAAIAIAPHGELGIDIECQRVVGDAQAIVDRHFAPAEREAWHALAPMQRDAAFLRCWTRKEACIKALGSGLSTPLHEVDAGLDGGPRSVRIATSAGAVLKVTSFEHGSGVLGAVAWLD